MRIITEETIDSFRKELVLEEKSKATVDKYVRDILAFAKYAEGKEIDKELVIAYKRILVDKYAVRSVNSIVASINSFFNYLCWHECKMKTIKLQQQIFCPEEKELTKEDLML